MTQSTQHGEYGSDKDNFIRMLEKQPRQHTKKDLALLALDMQSSPDSIGPAPDAEENMYVPAGYTYFGQFVDHDLTFDTTSTFDGVHPPTNLRTPRFDLDCVFGKGPIDQPEMYEADGATLKLGNVVDPASGRRDLARGADDRAIIGDPRNDENSLVSQIQAAFIRFHNANVKALAATGLADVNLFSTARCHTRWTYQRILCDDYLRRIVDGDIYAAFEEERVPDAKGLSTRPDAFVLYDVNNRAALPLEFSGAAYRFGHSMIRNGYILQDGDAIPIFDGTMGADSLLGFQALPTSHVITDWRRFFPDSRRESNNTGNTMSPAPGTAAGKAGANDSEDDATGLPRLQWAYRIDTSIVDPLSALPAMVAADPPPSLLVRNLWRGAAFQLPSGQDFERRLFAAGKIAAPLDKKYLVTRQELKERNANGEKQFRYVAVSEEIGRDTPLWFFILAEAQRPMVDKFGGDIFDEEAMKAFSTETAAQLGPVGGRILLEVFHGLLDSDPDSYRNHPDAEHWQPRLESLRMWDIVTTP